MLNRLILFVFRLLISLPKMKHMYDEQSPFPYSKGLDGERSSRQCQRISVSLVYLSDKLS